MSTKDTQASVTIGNKGELEADEALKIVRNIRLSDGARDWILRHYMDPDLDDPSQLRFIPTLAHSLATYNDKWRKIAGPHYLLVKGEPSRLQGAVVSPFENGRKFFAIRFAEAFDENARYLIEYEDGVWYVLKE